MILLPHILALRIASIDVSYLLTDSYSIYFYLLFHALMYTYRDYGQMDAEIRAHTKITYFPSVIQIK